MIAFAAVNVEEFINRLNVEELTQVIALANARLEFVRDATLNNEEKNKVRSGNLIAAVKAYKDRTGAGLGESKIICEAFRSQWKSDCEAFRNGGLATLTDDEKTKTS